MQEMCLTDAICFAMLQNVLNENKDGIIYFDKMLSCFGWELKTKSINYYREF